MRRPARMFKPQRFAQLARAQWAEQHRSWAGFLLALALLYVLVLLLVLSTTTGQFMLRTSSQAVYYTAGLLISGFVFAGRYFADVHRREGNLLLLMQPASAFEKILLAAVVILLLYPLAYTALFELLTWPARKLAFAMTQAHFEEMTSAVMHKRDAPNPQDYAAFWPFLPSLQALRLHSLFALVYAAGTGFALACSLYFGRAALLKTLSLGFGLFLITTMWMALTGPSMSTLAVWWQPQWMAASWRAHGLTAALWLGCPALLWLSAYWNLRERQLS